MPPEILFIERCFQLLKENGRMAIVLPDAVLGAPGLQYVRFWILEKMQLLASIDLAKDTFQPKNGTQTSVLFLRKKTNEEVKAQELSGKTREYKVFMAMVEHIGHDKRGNIVYKRDPEGNEIVTMRKEKIKDEEDGKIFEKEIEVQEKIINDETSDVARLYSQWKIENKTDYPEFDF